MRALSFLPQARARHFQVLLRIRHPSIDPALITEALQIQPEHAFRAGQRRQSTLSGASSAHCESFWLGQVNYDDWSRGEGNFFGTLRSQSLATHARDALAEDASTALLVCSVLLRRHSALLRRVQDEGGQTQLLVQLDQRSLDGFTLSSEFMRLLGDVGVSVEFELAEAAISAARGG